MLPFNKTGLFFFTATSLFIATTAFAQYGSYTPAMNAMFAQRNMQNMQNMQHQMMGMMYGTSNASFEYTFKARMKDGTESMVRSAIYADTSLHKSYIVSVDNRLPKKDPNRNTKIYPDQTLSIDRASTLSNGSIAWITGTPKDSCWMFKAIVGPINAYSFLSVEKEGTLLPEEAQSLIAVQFNDGPILKLNEENLTAMVGSDNPEMLKSIKKKDYYSVIKKYNKDILKKATAK